MKQMFLINRENCEAEIRHKSGETLLIHVDGKEFEVRLISQDGHRLQLECGGETFTVYTSNGPAAGETHTVVNGLDIFLAGQQLQQRKKMGTEEGQMLSPMPGKILKVMVKKGEQVQKGVPLLILEAMKMEHTIRANAEGVVKAIHFREGEQVQGGVDLVDIAPTAGKV